MEDLIELLNLIIDLYNEKNNSNLEINFNINVLNDLDYNYEWYKKNLSKTNSANTN